VHKGGLQIVRHLPQPALGREHSSCGQTTAHCGGPHRVSHVSKRFSQRVRHIGGAQMGSHVCLHSFFSQLHSHLGAHAFECSAPLGCRGCPAAYSACSSIFCASSAKKSSPFGSAANTNGDSESTKRTPDTKRGELSTLSMLPAACADSLRSAVAATKNAGTHSIPAEAIWRSFCSRRLDGRPR